MKRRVAIPLLVAGLLAIVTFLFLRSCDRSHLAYLPPDAVILAFGDSLTAGTGAAENESYPAVLESLIHRRVINAGLPGEVSRAGRTRLPQLLDEYRPRLLILCHGGNDFLNKTSVAEAGENVRSMVRAARDRGIDVVLIAVPEMGLLLSPADFYQDIASEFRIPCEQKILPQILSHSSLKSDTIHPNAEGYRKLAEAIAMVLKNKGALGP